MSFFLVHVDPCTRPLGEGEECMDDSEPDASTRYYYDSEDNSCKEFEYTGCGGNTNRFRSLRYCERRCVNREEEDSESNSKFFHNKCLFENITVYYFQTSGGSNWGFRDVPSVSNFLCFHAVFEGNLAKVLGCRPIFGINTPPPRPANPRTATASNIE